MSSTTTQVFANSPIRHGPCLTRDTKVSATFRSAAVDVSKTYYMDTSRVPFSHLSSELKALVCEQLQDTDVQSLRRLRLVCRDLNAVATPACYRILEFNELLVHQNAQRAYPKTLFKHIAQFTKHVIIRSNLNPAGVRGILSFIPSPASITWRFEQDQLNTGGTCMPSDVLDMDRMRKQGTKLHVENLPMQQLDSDAYLRGIPSSVLASIKVAGPAAPLTGQLPALKELILNSRNLEVLSFQDKGLGTQLRFGPGERMPPLTELSLRSYDWNHSEREVREHWDFSRLQSLELMSVPYYNFLSSVPRGSLSNLRSLQLEDWSAHLEDRRLEATGLLYDLLRHQIKSLTSLGVSCHVQRLPLDAILKHRNLEELRLRDHVGFAAEHLRCPTLEPRDLAALGRNLVRLRSLEIDMDHRVCSPEDFLRALMHFPRLDRLTLHVQTTVRTNDEADDDYYDRVAQEDRDHDAAMHIFSLLTSGRAQTNPDLLWKHITINVGGWRRIMVRRLGSAWRALNERGVFAERCFVMKRTNGQYGTHEISCDVPSSRPTPGSRALSPAVYEIR